ncbi:Ig-like domain-containing protein [Algoriphagus terrigena]|uniref:Ig-like domain-containing protein n=1 Tax=Algoriphagus terrigena TaxID=344884 RepID=UPI0003FC6026|nr:Ig-like domain-containing protein [Algoriphagus terrigena]
MKKLYYLLLACAIFYSCSGEDEPGDEKITVSESQISIDYEETYTLEATFNRDGYAPGSLVWSSADEEIATVDNNGKVTAGLVGETELTVKTTDGLFSEKVNVEVLPTVTVYKEPVLKFGESGSFVKSNETRTIDSETADFIIYAGENPEVLGVMYLFENAKLNYVAVLLKTDESTVEKAAYHLIQRYNAEGSQEDVYFFSRGEVSLGITIDPTLGLVVIYVQGESSPGGRMMDFKTRLEALKTQVGK